MSEQLNQDQLRQNDNAHSPAVSAGETGVLADGHHENAERGARNAENEGDEITEQEKREIKWSAIRILDFIGLSRSRVKKLCERYNGRCPECGRMKPGMREEKRRERISRIPLTIV